MKEQVLTAMDLERGTGITIKLQACDELYGERRHDVRTQT